MLKSMLEEGRAAGLKGFEQVRAHFPFSGLRSVCLVANDNVKARGAATKLAIQQVRVQQAGPGLSTHNCVAALGGMQGVS